MIHTLALDQALYYLGDIYHKIKIDKVYVSPELKVRYFELYAFAYLYAGKYQSSLMICDNIKNIGKRPLKILSVYSPPEHPFGTIHKTKEMPTRQNRPAR